LLVMNKRVQVGIALLFVAILGTAAWVRLYPPEPRFQGRTARQWFEQCAESVQNDGTIQDAAAVRAGCTFASDPSRAWSRH